MAKAMFEFTYLWFVFLFPLPLLVMFFAPEYKVERRSVKTPFFTELTQILGGKAAGGKPALKSKIFPWFLWTVLIVTLMRPQIIEAPVIKTVSSRDLLIAIDLSGSMETEDFKNSKGTVINRLDAVKEVLHDFLARRKGDRVSLIFFGSAAFLQMPFTEDLEVCRRLLDEAQVKMAGPTTKIGDAIGLSVKIFERSSLKDKLLILLTDGNDTGSQVHPLKAAEIARDSKIKIHTVAVGDPQSAGEEKLDEKTLKKISAKTGGRFFRAIDRTSLHEIYSEIDKIDTRKLETVSHRPRKDIYFWPLSMFLILTVTYQVVNLNRTVEAANG